MNNELVSIIMSVYDGDSPEFLIESIQSIIDQDYDNIEIILIGDGVKNTLLISSIESIVNNNKKVIRYFPQDINLGLASCMNKAIDLSKGEFLARMDADDIMERNRITLQSDFLRLNSEIDIVGSYIMEFNLDSGTNKLIRYPLMHVDMQKSFGRRNPLAHPSVMFKRSFFNKSGKYPLDTLTDEDTILWLRAFLNGCRFANIDLPLTKMRVSNDFFSRRKGVKKGLNDLNNRILVISRLNLPFVNYLYALGRFFLQTLPFAKVKEFAYNNFR